MAFIPKQLYGRCPIGHNLAPSGATAGDISTTQMNAGEEQPLFWSNYHQKYICAFCLRRVDDLKDDARFHERDKRLEKERQGMGFVQG